MPAAALVPFEPIRAGRIGLRQAPYILHELPENHVRQVSLEASHGLLVGLPLRLAPSDIGLRIVVVAQARPGHHVQGVVELSVAPPVEAVPSGRAR